MALDQKDTADWCIVSDKYGILFRPGSPMEIVAAENAGVPESLLEFYREFDSVESEQGEIRFYSLEQVVAQMTDFVSSVPTFASRLFCVSTSEHGDSYFVHSNGKTDFRHMAVYLFSHEADFRRVSATQVEEFAIIVAEGIPDFLLRAVPTGYKHIIGQLTRRYNERVTVPLGLSYGSVGLG